MPITNTRQTPFVTVTKSVATGANGGKAVSVDAIGVRGNMYSADAAIGPSGDAVARSQFTNVANGIQTNKTAVRLQGDTYVRSQTVAY